MSILRTIGDVMLSRFLTAVFIVGGACAIWLIIKFGEVIKKAINPPPRGFDE